MVMKYIIDNPVFLAVSAVIEHDRIIQLERRSISRRNPTGRLLEKQMRIEPSEKVEEDGKTAEFEDERTICREHGRG